MNDITPWLTALHANPFRKIDRLIFADWCDDNGKEEWGIALRNGHIPVTAEDQTAADLLDRCRFSPGTWDKRFARDVWNKLNGKEDRRISMTPKQFLWLWVIVRRYRKQIKGNGSEPLRNKIVEIAERRYKGYVELLEQRHWRDKAFVPMRTKKTDDRAFYLDDE